MLGFKLDTVMSRKCFRSFSGFENIAEGRCRDSKRQREFRESRDTSSANMNYSLANTDCITTFGCDSTFIFSHIGISVHKHNACYLKLNFKAVLFMY